MKARSWRSWERAQYRLNGGCSDGRADPTLVPMNETSIPDAFLGAISARDFGRLAECFAPSAQARLLLPRGPEVQSGPDDIARRFQSWFATGSDFSVLVSSHEPVGLRHRLTWRLRMSRNLQAPEIVEQVAFVDIGPDGISDIDLLCSGFMRDDAVASCAIDGATRRTA